VLPYVEGQRNESPQVSRRQKLPAIGCVVTSKHSHLNQAALNPGLVQLRLLEFDFVIPAVYNIPLRANAYDCSTRLVGYEGDGSKVIVWAGKALYLV